MELVRQKNVATYIVFPIVDNDGDLVSGAAALDSEIDAWTDGAAPDGFADCTNEAVEVGTTGIYYLLVTQAEMNNDYIVIQVKTSTADAKTQTILIRTINGDPLNLATTDDGVAIDMSALTSDLTIVDAQVDKTVSDMALLGMASLTSDLAVVDANVDKIVSDMAGGGIGTIASDLIIVDANVDKLVSDLALVRSDTTIITSDVAGMTTLVSDVDNVKGKVDKLASDMVDNVTEIEAVVLTRGVQVAEQDERVRYGTVLGPE